MQVFGHDSEAEVEVNGYESAYSYKRTITYDVSLEDIRTAVESYTNCRQFVKYRCRGAQIYGPYGGTYWKSYDGTLRFYWGGSDQNYHCACGVAGNCIDTSDNCNCDQNDSGIETFDEGYLTNKDHLPVIEVAFGDTGASTEIGWHTVGPLECW